MKFTCKVEEVAHVAPHFWNVDKKSAINQKFIIEFMNLEFITAEQKEELKKTIREEREIDAKKFMGPVRNKFLDMFYNSTDSKKKARPKFEDKF